MKCPDRKSSILKRTSEIVDSESASLQNSETDMLMEDVRT